MFAILCSIVNVNGRERYKVGELTGGIAQRGSWAGKSVGYILEVMRQRRSASGLRTHY